MKTIKQVVALLLICGTYITSYAGGPWLLGKNQAFVQAQAIVPVYSYSSLLMGNFTKDVQGVNRKTYNLDYGFYLEYGLSDKINLITKVPFKYVSTGELTDQTYFEDVLPSGNLSGLSNYELSIKYGLIDSDVKVALSLNTSWNTISQDLEKGLATGFDANSFGLTVHAGRSNTKHYGFAQLGFHKYSNNFSDIIKIEVEHGWNLGQRFGLAFLLDARHSLNNGSYYHANLSQTGLYPDNQEWIVISSKLNYETEKGWGANMAIPIAPLKFKSVGFNGTIGRGVYKKFN